MTTRWMAVLLAAAASLAAWGQSQPKPNPQDHFAITTQMVAQALSGRGARIEDRQVSLLARVVATEAHPALDILTVEPLGDSNLGEHPKGRIVVKLACHKAATCLPFYATVSWPAGPMGGASGSSAAAREAENNLLKPKAAVMMRAGTHATLVMDDDRSHIQIAVVSLESGVAGGRIRVASPDHKQVYLGEVVSASLLKRSF